MSNLFSFIGSWILKNWLPVLIVGVLAGGYLWVNNLRHENETQKSLISELQGNVQKLTTELQQQEEAFKILESSFNDYVRIMDTYLEELESVVKRNEANEDTVRDSGSEDERNKPVDDYTRRVLEKLCQLNPDYC